MMEFAKIDLVIRSMCKDIDEQESPASDWRLLTESELLYEMFLCIAGSQVVFEMSVATADLLKSRGLLNPPSSNFDQKTFEANVSKALEDRVSIVNERGETCWRKPRFRNRLASLLGASMAKIYSDKKSIHSILSSVITAADARKILVSNVCGFGPKQASLFLRRVGFCSDLAVLDVHILDYMREARGVSWSPQKLGRLPVYEEVEFAFREVAKEFGYPMGCVDLATWITMRVAKRELYI